MEGLPGFLRTHHRHGLLARLRLVGTG
jgi:hypothetical protein